MRKRAALARALALDPELLFLDEPTAGLDPLSASGIDELVRQLRDALGLTHHDGHPRSRPAVARRGPRGGAGRRRILGTGTMAELSRLRAPADPGIFRRAARPRRARAGMEAKVNYAVVGAFVLVLGAALIGGRPVALQRRRLPQGLRHLLDLHGRIGIRPEPRRAGQVSRRRSRPRAQDRAGAREYRAGAVDAWTSSAARRSRSDTVAVLRMQGLTGIGYVELTGGRRDSPPLLAQPGEDYPVIRSGPSLMVRLDCAVSALLTNVNRIEREHQRADGRGQPRARSSRPWRTSGLVSRTLAARSARDRFRPGERGAHDGEHRAPHRRAVAARRAPPAQCGCVRPDVRRRSRATQRERRRLRWTAPEPRRGSSPPRPCPRPSSW